ncbi:MAG: beta-ketoacyl-[acyl-carrier-protein] synthase family protein [Planctomycetales bacterium]|nr:beta-ketoacyl-[acyl-carrier-protein] synthase family protein [Planctomycetales bacterium]
MSSPPPSQRVVITGIGLVSPSGNSAEELWANLSAGHSSAAIGATAPAGCGPIQVASESSFTGSIKEFGELQDGVKKAIRKALKLMCRETQMAVAAAQLAIADAAVKTEDHKPEASGVVIGSDYMLTMPEDCVRGVQKCTQEGKFRFTQWGDQGLAEVEPLWMLRYLPNMPASHIAIFNDHRGPNNSLTMREASGLMAIGEAARIIARGHAQLMVAGATGTRLLPMQAIHVAQTEQLAKAGDDPATASRPFDKSRTGMVPGEGAATLVLESLESAQTRGATIYGEVLGFGSSQVTDAKLQGRNDKALATAMKAALADASLKPAEVGHINAHGLATTKGDIAEAQAIASVFGEHPVPVTALKSYFGNLGAASGVVELIGSLMALKYDSLPRILNYRTPDPACPITAATESGASPGDSFVSTNATPQGQAVAVVVGRV